MIVNEETEKALRAIEEELDKSIYDAKSTYRKDAFIAGMQSMLCHVEGALWKLYPSNPDNHIPKVK